MANGCSEVSPVFSECRVTFTRIGASLSSRKAAVTQIRVRVADTKPAGLVYVRVPPVGHLLKSQQHAVIAP